MIRVSSSRTIAATVLIPLQRLLKYTGFEVFLLWSHLFSRHGMIALANCPSLPRRTKSATWELAEDWSSLPRRTKSATWELAEDWSCPLPGVFLS
jgi:hypothetical protein